MFKNNKIILVVVGFPDLETKTYMKKLGEEMIEYCGGLPLAITVLGGLLATKQTREEWEDVHKHVRSYLHEEQNLRVNKVLDLSYNDLPSHLKQCFLYLGHFPEDFEIPTKELIRMWMGEGFISQIQYRRGRVDTMDDVGDRYIRELVQRCMVLVGKEGSLGRIRTCRMHDLMRDFCISKAQDENFLHFTSTLSMKQGETQIGKVRRLAIVSESGHHNLVLGIKFNEYPYLRSLLYLLPVGATSYFEESSFQKFKLVRVLHLENFTNRRGKLPKDLGCLIHLRYLSFKGCIIHVVPSSICNLRCLETLDLRARFCPSYCVLRGRVCRYTLFLDSNSGLRVPNVFKYMKQLKHLYLPSKYRVCGKLELANLSYLHTLVNVQPKTIQIPRWFKPRRLRVLKVWNNKRAQDAMQELISRCPHMEKLNLRCHIEKLPESDRLSPNLAKLTLYETYLKQDPMPTLEKWSSLKFLRLSSQSFVGKYMVCFEGGFPLLRCLVIQGLFDLVRWKVEKAAMPNLCRLEFRNLTHLEEWRMEEGAMPNLCHLEICSCKELKTIPDGLRFVRSLKELEVRYMRKSFKDRLHEGGLDFDKIKHVPSRVFQDCGEE